MTDENQDATRIGDAAPRASFKVDADVRARLVAVATKAGVDVDEFVEGLLRRMAEAEVHFERGVPVLPRRPGARVVTVEDVERLASE
jgi:antitoxin component of RelBE/YafQ-DinJ toxin-antitoxin module